MLAIKQTANKSARLRHAPRHPARPYGDWPALRAGGPPSRAGLSGTRRH